MLTNMITSIQNYGRITKLLLAMYEQYSSEEKYDKIELDIHYTISN